MQDQLTTTYSRKTTPLLAALLLAVAWRMIHSPCMHMAWNFTEGGIFSAAVSGGAGKGLLQANLFGPDWLTGGKFGVEASVVALAICFSAAIVALILAAKRRHIVPASWNKRTASSTRQYKDAWPNA